MLTPFLPGFFCVMCSGGIGIKIWEGVKGAKEKQIFKELKKSPVTHTKHVLFFVFESSCKYLMPPFGSTTNYVQFVCMHVFTKGTQQICQDSNFYNHIWKLCSAI